MANYRHTNSKGFTLIELMVTIAVLLIAIAIAAPNLANMVQRNRLQTTADNLAEALRMARNETIDSGELIAVQPISSADWGSGWKLVQDVDTLSTRIPRSEFQFKSGLLNDNVAPVAFSATSIAEITFNRDGSRRTPTNLSSYGIFVCSLQGGQQRYKGVIIYANGMIQVKDDIALPLAPNPCL